MIEKINICIDFRKKCDILGAVRLCLWFYGVANMKKIMVSALCICIGVVTSLSADMVQSPSSSAIMAQGGAGGITSGGYDALFNNPAGFACDPSSFTLVSTQPWVYTLPETFPDLMTNLSDGDSDGVRSIIDEGLPSNGFGVGGSAGLGWVGSGIGLGISATFDSYIYEKESSILEGDALFSVSAVLGYAVPFDIGKFRIIAGADLRPTLRIDADLSNDEAHAFLESLASWDDPIASISEAEARYGVGFAIDAGLIVDAERFRLGVAVRDLGDTRYAFETETFSDALSNLTGGNLPPDRGDEEYVPMTINAGASFHLFGGRLATFIDPVLIGEIHDVKAFIDSLQGDDTSPLLYTHIGADIGLFDIIHFRGGLNQGNLTAGIGLDLPVIDLSAAYFTRELGAAIGEQRSSGLTFDAAIRF